MQRRCDGEKAGGYPTSVAGPRYDFTKFKGKTKPPRCVLCLAANSHITRPANTSVALLQVNHLTRHAHLGTQSQLSNEHLSAAIDGFLLTALKRGSSFLYGKPAWRAEFQITCWVKSLKIQNSLAIVSIDTFINETAALSTRITSYQTRLPHGLGHGNTVAWCCDQSDHCSLADCWT